MEQAQAIAYAVGHNSGGQLNCAVTFSCLDGQGQTCRTLLGIDWALGQRHFLFGMEMQAMRVRVSEDHVAPAALSERILCGRT